MNDPRFPDLPSDEELGITEEDVRAYEEERGGHAHEPPARPGPGGGPDGTGEPSAPGDSVRRAGRDAKVRGAPRAPSRLARWRGPLTLLAVLGLGWVSSIRTGLPPALPPTAPDTAFSAARAMDDLLEVARAPRPPGAPEHARVRAWLLARLDSMGLGPEVQTAIALHEGPDFARAATVRNVVARIPGTDPTGAVVLTAHYDGVPHSPAAGDDGSGVVTILETARALLAGPPPRNDVIVLLSDGEEVGLLGARAFLEGHRWAGDTRVVLSFEMRGAGGPSIMFQTAEGNGRVVRELRRARPRAFATSLGDAFFRYMPNRTDFNVFADAGVQGLDFAAIDGAAVYHTPRDTPSRLLDRTLQHHGLHALDATRHFADADLGDMRGPDVAYFTLPLVGLIVHPESWVWPLFGLVLAVALGGLFLARRRGARASGIVVGTGVAMVALSLGYGAGILLLELARPAHAEAGRLPGALFYGEGWYVTALAAAAVLAATLPVWMARRWLSSDEMALGAVLLPVAGGGVLAVAAPPAAPIVLWPLLASVVGIAGLSASGTRLPEMARWGLALLVAVPIVFFLLPATELLWLAGSLAAAGALGAFMVAALLLQVALLEALRSPNGWWLPLTCALLAGAAFGMGRLGAAPSAETPVPTTLLWVRDPEGVGTVWATRPTAATPSDPGGAAAGAAGPDELVGSWLAERAGGPFARTVDLAGIGHFPGPAAVREAPDLELVPPELVIVADSALGLVRRVTLGVRSRIGAEVLHFGRPNPNAMRILHVGGRPLATPERVRWVEHWGEPDSLVAIGLEIPPGGSLDLVIAEHHLRAPELLGPGTFARPPELVADPLGSSDRAISVTRFRPAATRSAPAEEPAPEVEPGEPS